MLAWDLKMSQISYGSKSGNRAIVETLSYFREIVYEMGVFYICHYLWANCICCVDWHRYHTFKGTDLIQFPLFCY